MAIEKWGAPKAVTGPNGANEGTVTALPNGGYVIVWDSNGITSVQVFDGLGNPVGARQDIASTVGEPKAPKVTVLQDGSFVVGWSGASTTIQAQKFSITGVKDGGLFTIATPTSQDPATNDHPSFASDSNGWVAVWDTTTSLEGTIQFMRQGGTKFTIKTGSGVTQPDVTQLKDGSHVVVWESSGSIKVAHVALNNTVTELADAFAGSGADGPTITALSNGGFVVAWQQSIQEHRKFSTQAFTKNQSGQFVHTATGSLSQQGEYTAYPPEIVALTKGGFDGGYAIVHEDWVGDDNGDIYLRLVRADGTVSEVKLINDGDLKRGDQGGITSVTELPDGRISIVWDDGTATPSVIRNQIIDAREIAVTVEGSAHNDIYIGSKFDGDRLSGNGGADQLYGGAGSDTLMGGAGADTLDGGAGTADWADYSDSNGVVVVDLRTGTGSGSYADGDVLRGIENLRGSNVINNTVKDILIGNEVANHIMGGAGDDWLYGGAGNGVADTLEGGGEYNRVTYEYSTAGVGITLDLDHQERNTGEANNDVFRNITAYEGTRYADNMTGHAAQYNELYGNSGNDYLAGGDRDDYLDGGEGDDVLEGGASDDILKDVLEGGNGFDYASYANAERGVRAYLDDEGDNFGDADGDIYRSIEGLIGSARSDVLNGNSAGNVIIGGDDVDYINGLNGSDTLIGGTGGDQIFGGDGFDYASYANAGAGITADLSNIAVPGLLPGGFASLVGSGDAAGDGYSGVEGLIGSNFGDTLYGDGQNNHLQGLGGNDVLNGGAGADTLAGGVGDDTYYVGAGDSIVEAAGQGTDTVVVTSSFTLTPGAVIENIVLASTAVVNLTGNELDNVLTGNAAANVLDGQAGNDVIVGGAGADAMTGGLGNDIIYVDDAGDVVVEHAGQGSDTVMVNTAVYTLSAGAEVETLVAGAGALNLTGSNFANAITGNSLNNSLWGLSGNDRLMGDAGNDRLYGGVGNDRLSGGLGNDQLKGDAGRDVFVFDTRTNKRTNVDKVIDFKSRDDDFYLDNAIFTKLGSGTDARPKKFKSDMFVEGTRAQDREDRIVYDKKTGSLYYDKDGTGGSAQVKIATISNKTKLYYNDFYVI